MTNKPVYISGKRIILRPLMEEDFNEEYLGWLNDPEVNRYSQRRPYPVNWQGMTSYNEYLKADSTRGFNLAIVVKDSGKHIGNAALLNIHPINRCADLAILIGNKEYWNKGYASEAIYHLTKHAFRSMNLHKIIVGSFNPAFIRCVEKLGWGKEGEFKERIWSDGCFHNQIWMSMLEQEFKTINKFEE